MTFLGPKRWTEDVHPHESPPVMTVPLIVLAFGRSVGGAAPDRRRLAGRLAGRRSSAGPPGGRTAPLARWRSR